MFNNLSSISHRCSNLEKYKRNKVDIAGDVFRSFWHKLFQGDRFFGLVLNIKCSYCDLKDIISLSKVLWCIPNTGSMLFFTVLYTSLMSFITLWFISSSVRYTPIKLCITFLLVVSCRVIVERTYLIYPIHFYWCVSTWLYFMKELYSRRVKIIFYSLNLNWFCLSDDSTL